MKSFEWVIICWCTITVLAIVECSSSLIVGCSAFTVTTSSYRSTATTKTFTDTSLRASNKDDELNLSRRSVLSRYAAATAAAVGVAVPDTVKAATTAEEGFTVQAYADFTQTNEGWSYRDVTVGNGSKPSMGSRVVYEWSGYTIGYFGRPFEAKGGPQGGAFDKSDKDYSRTVLGSGEIVKGLECALLDMQVGGVRQVLVPYGALSYPSTSEDGNHDKVGPKPTTFSGLRALNFVLDNPRVDRTLLFNVKLVRVDQPDGKGGFKRGDKMTG